ncbi:Ig-like domain-containing protein [Terrisporobacter hibernicus]|uniref:Ig-like domain-containing protein n=1 Tax=Terrisporobacter hibernicus TaxID=2813371 RepID=UPI001E363179|nr:Ig-like domain-containing protein [Terrisporobacter hibernicus]
MKKKLLSSLLALMLTLTPVSSIFACNWDEPSGEFCDEYKNFNDYDLLYYYYDFVSTHSGFDHKDIELGETVNKQTKNIATGGIYNITFKETTTVRINYTVNSPKSTIRICDEYGNEINTNYGDDDIIYADGYELEHSTYFTFKPGTYQIVILSAKGKYSLKLSKAFKTFTVNSINSSSTKITGKGLKGSTATAYANGKQIGKTTVPSNGNYAINIKKQKSGAKVTVKLRKTDYYTESITKKVSSAQFNTFTVNSIKSSSTKITGKGLKGATVRAYIGKKQIGKSTVKSNNTYSIRIPKQKKGKKVTVKISKSGYTTKAKSVTVKSSSTSSSSKYVYWNGGSSRSKIYHKTSRAHGMKGAVKMTEKQAKSRGYRACKSCW